MTPLIVLSPWLATLQRFHVPPELLAAAFATQTVLQRHAHLAIRTFSRLPLWLALLNVVANAVTLLTAFLFSFDPFIVEVWPCDSTRG